MSYFVFLEFGDQRIVTFLTSLKNALAATESSGPAHVTLRGPYVEPPDPATIEDLRERLHGNGVRIAGAGKFETPVGTAVYLRAESSVFPAMWWKPDYPSRDKRITPHVTLFETNNARAADQVLRFLKQSRISIYTFNVELSIYTRKQEELFGRPLARPPRYGGRSIRRDIIEMGPEVLARARTLGQRIRADEAANRSSTAR